MKKNRIKDNFLKELTKVPIVQVACEKTGVSRNSVYRWRNGDEEFKKEMDNALLEGEALINDLTESQLLSLIKEKSWPAISFWLKHRNAKYKEKLEITTKTEFQDKLTPEQENLVREALLLVSTETQEIINKNNNDQHDTKQ